MQSDTGSGSLLYRASLPTRHHRDWLEGVAEARKCRSTGNHSLSLCANSVCRNTRTEIQSQAIPGLDPTCSMNGYQASVLHGTSPELHGCIYPSTTLRLKDVKPHVHDISVAGFISPRSYPLPTEREGNYQRQASTSMSTCSKIKTYLN